LKLILAASAALVAYLGWRSLGWPLVHDAPLMHYVAWLISQGAVPYRDVFDMNLPGVYLLHWAVISLVGTDDLGWRLFDLAWLAATCGLLWTYGRGLGDRWARALSPALFALYHLSGGAWRVGQRDFLLCAFLLAGALGVARSAEREGALFPLVWSGLALGAGLTVKPQSALYWLACAAAAGWALRRSPGRAMAGVAAVLAAGLVAPVLAFGWVAWLGGHHAFAEIMGGYVIPLYSRVGRASLWEAFGWYRLGRLLWALLGVLLLASLRAAPPAWRGRRALALLGVAYGWVHFAAQGKGWEYHLYPLALFVCVLSPLAVVRPAGGGSVAGRLRRGFALATVGALVLTLGVKGAGALEEPWIVDKAQRVAAITRDLRPLVRPGGTAQVLDVTEGGIHALLRLGVRQPTRFLYDFHFFHDVDDPRIRALQAEFVRDLRDRGPDAVVVLEKAWNHPGYGRLDEIPGLAPLLATEYRLAVEGDGYRIYAKRHGS